MYPAITDYITRTNEEQQNHVETELHPINSHYAVTAAGLNGLHNIQCV